MALLYLALAAVGIFMEVREEDWRRHERWMERRRRMQENEQQ